MGLSERWLQIIHRVIHRVCGKVTVRFQCQVLRGKTCNMLKPVHCKCAPDWHEFCRANDNRRDGAGSTRVFVCKIHFRSDKESVAGQAPEWVARGALCNRQTEPARFNTRQRNADSAGSGHRKCGWGFTARPAWARLKSLPVAGVPQLHRPGRVPPATTDGRRRRNIRPESLRPPGPGR